MRLLISLASTIGLAAVLMACGGSSKQEETTPATGEEAAPATEQEGAQPEGEAGSEGGEAEQPPAPSEDQAEKPAGGGGW